MVVVSLAVAGTMVVVLLAPKAVPAPTTTSTSIPVTVPESARPTKSEVRACTLGRLATWMGCLVAADPIGNLPLSGLAIPGSHNAGAFELDPPPSTTERGSACSDLGPKPPASGDELLRWSTTQDLTLTQQLDGGVRYVDLQIGYNGNGSAALGWRVVQNEYSDRPLYDYLDQIAVWAKAHPSEVVLVDLRTICYDHHPTRSYDDGLWSSFATPSDVGGGGSATIASVAFDPTRLGAGSLATASIDEIVHRAAAGTTWSSWYLATPWTRTCWRTGTTSIRCTRWQRAGLGRRRRQPHSLSSGRRIRGCAPRRSRRRRPPTATSTATRHRSRHLSGPFSASGST